MDDNGFEHVWAATAAFWLIAPRLGLFSALPQRWDDALRPFAPLLGYLIAAVCLVLWPLQLSTGAGTAPLPGAWPSPQRWLALTIIAIAWIAVLWWAFPGQGATRIAERAAADVRRVKASFLVVIVASAAITIGQYRIG